MAEPVKVDVYVDGACLGNPGPGGYGIIIKLLGQAVRLQGGAAKTTNNVMELMGAIRALEQIPQRDNLDITVYSDSSYVVNGFAQHWVAGWKRRGWRKSDGKPVKNVELWQQLDELQQRTGAKFVWVPGHMGVPENEECDGMAKQAAENYRDGVTV